MLILAGVSLNAIIGDNGVINQAQNSNFKSSMVQLEEFLQENYVNLTMDESIEIQNDDGSDKTPIEILLQAHRDWFYRGAPLTYIVDSNGKIHYYLNISKLKEDSKIDIKGGTAGGQIVSGVNDYSQYHFYAENKDVYGVTSNLKLYYYQSDGTLFGEDIEFDDDNPIRQVFTEASSWTNVIVSQNIAAQNALNTYGYLPADTLKSLKTLTIDSESTIISLDALYNFPSLQSLTLDGVNMTSLAGIENASSLNSILIQNGANIGNYEAIGKCGSRINKLYFYNITDEEVDKLCGSYDDINKKGIPAGISLYNLSGLEYFAIVGNNTTFTNTNYYDDEDNAYFGTYVKNKSSNVITKISQLNNLKTSTKNSIKYLFINNNNITSLNGISNFLNLYCLKAECNEIKDISSLANLKSLSYIWLQENKLGEDEVFDIDLEDSGFGKNPYKDSMSYISNNLNLVYLGLDNNIDLKWIGYLSTNTSLRYLKLDGCLEIKDMNLIKNIAISCGGKFSADNKFSIDLLDPETTSLDVSGLNLTLSNLESIRDCSKINRLNFSNVKVVGGNDVLLDSSIVDVKLNDMLNNLNSMISLSLNGVSQLTTISYLENKTKSSLKELDLRGTDVTDLSNLNGKNLKLRSLLLDKSDINLSPIVSVIKNMEVVGTWNVSGGNNGWLGTTIGGLILDNQVLLDKLSNLTTLDHLSMAYGSKNTDYVIDLSKMSALSNASIGYIKCKSITVPSSLTNLGIDQVYKPDGKGKTFTLNTAISGNLTSFYIAGDSNLGNVCKLVSKIARCNGTFCGSNFTSYLTLVPNEANLHITLRTSIADLSVITQNISGVKGIYNYYIDNYGISGLDHLKYFTDLKYLRIRDVINFSDTTNIAKVTTLTGLELSGDSISDLSFLIPLTNLQTLYLNDNPIYDKFSYVDEDGVSHENVDSLKILADLNVNKGGSLSKLELSGTYITNFDIVIDSSNTKFSSLSWPSGHLGW